MVMFGDLMMHDRLAVGFRNLKVQILKLLTSDARARADAVVAHRNEVQMTRNRWILLSLFGIYLAAARLHIAAYCALSIYGSVRARGGNWSPVRV